MVDMIIERNRKEISGEKATAVSNASALLSAIATSPPREIIQRCASRATAAHPSFFRLEGVFILLEQLTLFHRDEDSMLQTLILAVE